MELKTNKRGFAFTFLAFFVVFILYVFASLSFNDRSFSNEKQFEFQRIESVYNEYNYFTSIYLKDAVRLSAYKSLWILINESQTNKTLYNYYAKNYSIFNSFILEGMNNGSINGTRYSQLDGFTLINLTKPFQDMLLSDYKTNSTITITKINVFEDKPFYVSVQIQAKINLSMLDNLSSWESTNEYVYSFPIFEFPNPQYSIIGNFVANGPKVNPIDLFTSNQNWSLDLFNKTLQNDLVTVYYNSELEYSYGTSFLKSLFNYSTGSYKNVLGFWSFDFDKNHGGFYDTTLNNNLGSKTKSSILSYFPFELNDLDQTDYPSGSSSINLEYSQTCPKGNCSIFNGTSSFSIDNNQKFNTSLLKEFSISFWENASLNNVEVPFIYITANTSQRGFYIYYSNTTQALHLNLSCGNSIQEFIFPSSLENQTWEMITFQFDFENEVVEYYLNSLLSQKEYISSNCKNYAFENPIVFGRNVLGSSFLNSALDNLVVSNKVFTPEVLKVLHELQPVWLVDYKETFLGKAYEVTNSSEVMLTTNTSVFDLSNDYTLEFWIYPYTDNNESILLLNDNTSNANLSIYKNNTHIIFETGGKIISTNYSLNTWNQYLLSSSSLSSVTQLYHNGKLLESQAFDFSVPNPITHIHISSTNASLTNHTNSFYGMIDEIRILNETTPQDKAMFNYYNTNSYTKGCCNYVGIFNPNKYGYNTLANKVNISYSTHVLMDYYFRSNQLNYNLTLYNITNITSTDTSEEYYNFLADVCMLDIFDIFSYSQSTSSANIVKVGSDNGECMNLVKAGLY
jgi:hypothetical protein